VSALSARAAYRLWAPHYDAETALSHLETETVATFAVATRGRSLLDVGCGTARRLRASDAATAVGVDLTIEMLTHTRAEHQVAAADARALPFGDASFDVVWCRLVLGHLPDPDGAYRELARVCRKDGSVVVSDLAAEAVHAGHRRTFHDAVGATHEVEHFVHLPDAHIAAAQRTGLQLDRRATGVVGPSIRAYYVTAGREHAYEAQKGLPLVLALLFRSTGAVK
jgi:malonyl-CoA O-methyltransferase